MARPVRLTQKQKNIMGLILQKAGQGTFLTVKELHEAVSHGDGCSYGAIRKSLDVLENASMIVRERRSGENTKEVKPTQQGYDWFRPLRD
jgi:Fe2+ or Zn2+ uptake regulation protein